MNDPSQQTSLPRPLWELFQQLRRHHFLLGPDDFHALWQAMHAGFGWSSQEELRHLCCALWAKSRREQEILIALFNQLFEQHELSEWKLLWQRVEIDTGEPETQQENLRVTGSSKEFEFVPIAEDINSSSTIPPILLNVELSKRPFILAPQFPVTYREVAQASRFLRRPLREGPPTELDIEGTVLRRCRSGVTSPVVLVPRRRNTIRLLLLVDRYGSMTPFHTFSEEICKAIQQAGRFEHLATYYYHDVPVQGADESVLDSLRDQLFPTLDPVLSQIEPLTDGYLYYDQELLSPCPLKNLLWEHATGASVILLSDAGAARGNYDVSRLLNTLAFLKALRTYTSHYVWLNPLPQESWKNKNNTATQIARYVPMFSLNREGIYRAINVLRGQPNRIERPL